MSEKDVIHVTAHVSAAERRIVVTAARRLATCLQKAGATDTNVAVGFDPANPACARPGLLILSPMADLASSDSIPAVEARWLELLDGYSSAGSYNLFLCTLFRHVPGGPDRAAVVERIRRLNLLMIGLSHARGAAVVDLDRVFTFFGARALATDYRLSGRAAGRLAAFAIVSAFFEEGLAPWLPNDIEKRAREVHGGESRMAAFMNDVKRLRTDRAEAPR